MQIFVSWRASGEKAHSVGVLSIALSLLPVVTQIPCHILVESSSPSPYCGTWLAFLWRDDASFTP